MRVVFLALLVAVVVHGGSIGDKIKGFLGEGNIAEKLKNIATGGIKKALENTGLLKVYDKLKGLREKIKSKLVLSPEKKAALLEKLKLLRNINRDHVSSSGDSIAEINQKKQVGEVLFQSDIALTKSQAEEIEAEVTGKRSKRQAFRDGRYPNTTWENGVAYDFHPTLSAKAQTAFLKAVEAWEKDTCIKFVKSRNGDHIDVTHADGCWSFVGRVGGTQDLSLGDGCDTVGIAAHELGHALGLYHTMSRYDRDEYITVNVDKIKPSYLDQFIKYTKDTTDNYGTGYDYGSIMHYGATSSSIDNSVTMLPSDVNYRETLGSAIISFSDLSIINDHYGCKKKCLPTKSAQCQNGGFPHPKDCQKCICPGGYGGALCNDRPAGCGAKLTATNEYQTLEDTLGDGGNENKVDFTSCNYWIESPQGTQIEIVIKSLEPRLSVDGCVYGGVEIKTNPDQKLTGYRFCSIRDEGVTLKSQSNRVPIITYNRSPRSTVALKYRIVPKEGAQSTKTDSVPKDKCFDEISCNSMKLIGFCRNKPIEEQKRRCPKACGHC